MPWRWARENTYAAPWKRLASTVAPGAPATIVPPEIATDVPGASNSAPSEEVSLLCYTNRSTLIGWLAPPATTRSSRSLPRNSIHAGSARPRASVATSP